MGNLLDILDSCVERNVSEDTIKPYALCTNCKEKYTPDIIYPQVCNNCKLLETNGLYEYEHVSLLKESVNTFETKRAKRTPPPPL
jgi:hypothetical protein